MAASVLVLVLLVVELVVVLVVALVMEDVLVIVVLLVVWLVDEVVVAELVVTVDVLVSVVLLVVWVDVPVLVVSVIVLVLVELVVVVLTEVVAVVETGMSKNKYSVSLYSHKLVPELNSQACPEQAYRVRSYCHVALADLMVSSTLWNPQASRRGGDNVGARKRRRAGHPCRAVVLLTTSPAVTPAQSSLSSCQEPQTSKAKYAPVTVAAPVAVDVLMTKVTCKSSSETARNRDCLAARKSGILLVDGSTA